MPLEPIEDKDLDLKNKFTEKVEAKPLSKNKEAEKMPILENMPVRKEGEMEKEKAYTKILSKVKTHVAPADDMVATDAQDANREGTAENKVEKLIQLALQKGVVHAVKVARHMEDNYSLDEFHDRILAEELHDSLVQKGLIKEI